MWKDWESLLYADNQCHTLRWINFTSQLLKSYHFHFYRTFLKIKIIIQIFIEKIHYSINVKDINVWMRQSSGQLKRLDMSRIRQPYKNTKYDSCSAGIFKILPVLNKEMVLLDFKIRSNKTRHAAHNTSWLAKKKKKTHAVIEVIDFSHPSILIMAF